MYSKPSVIRGCLWCDVKVGTATAPVRMDCVISKATCSVWENTVAEQNLIDAGIALGKVRDGHAIHSPKVGMRGSSGSFLKKCVYDRQHEVIAGSSCLSKLSSIRKYFWTAQLSLSNVRAQELVPSAQYLGDMVF